MRVLPGQMLRVLSAGVPGEDHLHPRRSCASGGFVEWIAPGAGGLRTPWGRTSLLMKGAVCGENLSPNAPCGRSPELGIDFGCDGKTRIPRAVGTVGGLLVSIDVQNCA